MLTYADATRTSISDALAARKAEQDRLIAERKAAQEAKKAEQQVC
jgi:hypothetical protein